jgi:hypothetical protein
MRKPLPVIFLLMFVCLPHLLAAQDLMRRVGGANGPPTVENTTLPVPMLADGTVDLSGVWIDGGAGKAADLLPAGTLDSLMQPWAREKYLARDPADDPYNWCMPGGPLRITGGFAWRFVQHPTLNATHIFMLQEGNAHSYRQIFMDGRQHPEDPRPTWYGHSIGQWEGDTLVIDTIGLNDIFWLDVGGTVHTEQLQLTERWTRIDYSTLHREVTINDPGAYTAPFTVSYTAKLGEPGSEILEYICIENNQYGVAGGIVPE